MEERIIVTGGAGEIGTAIAHISAARGGHVVIADLDHAAAQHTASQLRGAAHRASELDVASEASVCALFDAVEAGGRSISGLVCCAGGTVNTREHQPLMADTPLSDWIRTESVNARGTFLCIREFLRRRRERPVAGASVVAVSSIAGQLPGGPTGAAYAAAKAAILSLVRTAAFEGGPMGIRVNAVCPGAIDTGAFRRTVDADRTTAMLSTIPLRRMGTTRDVAEAICFLLSDAAGYITGSVIDVNGGRRMQ